MISIRPGKYRAAVIEATPGGMRLQTGWYRTHPPSDMLEYAIRHYAEDNPRMRVVYMLRATLPELPKSPVDVSQDADDSGVETRDAPRVP